MNSYNVYGGPVQTGPPKPFMGNCENDVMVFAGRPFGQQQTSYNPGGMGYNQVPADFMNPPEPNPMPMYQQQIYQQPQMNYGYPQMQPMMYQQPMYQQPQMNYGYPQMQPTMYQQQMMQPMQQPMGKVNPALLMIQQNPALANAGSQYGPYGTRFVPAAQQQFQDKVIHVPGINMGFGKIYSTDIYDQLENLQVEYMKEKAEHDAKVAKANKGYYNNNPGYNYYGMWNSQFYDTSIENKYRQKVADLYNQGVQRGNNLARHLSKLVHNYMGDPITDEDLDRMYSGYDVVIPGAIQQQDAVQAELSRFRTLNPSDPRDNPYLANFLAIKGAHNNLMQNVHNLNDFLEMQGVLKTLDLLEDEERRRRDGTQYFNGDAYHSYIVRNMIQKGKPNPMGQKVAEEISQMSQDEVQNEANAVKNNIPFGDNFPILNETMTMLEDGTFNFSFPKDMNSAYKNISPRQFIAEQRMEAHFQENKRKFLESIMNQPMEVVQQSGGPPNGS